MGEDQAGTRRRSLLLRRITGVAQGPNGTTCAKGLNNQDGKKWGALRFHGRDTCHGTWIRKLKATAPLAGDAAGKSRAAISDCGKVLVAEDDDGMREAIETLLEAAGIESAAYASAEALLASGATEGARCVISDLKLPAMSGLELLSVLRARGALPPVIMITAHDEPGIRDEAERLGAVAFLTKPFTGSVLLAAIASAVSPAKLR